MAFFGIVALTLFLLVTEVLLQRVSGLGNPVLFFTHPDFGYRLQPNQETYRFGGSHFKINNLGLRAIEDWNSDIDDKIIFLGDSVTYGGNRISNEELFSELAIENMHGFESGNAGMPNYGVENVYGLVVESEFLPARYYVTTFIEEDFYRGLVLPENRPWIMTEKPRFALEEATRWLWYRYVANTRATNQSNTERVPADVRREIAVKKLKIMDEFLKAKGLRHIIFISPSRAQVLEHKKIDADLKAELDKYEIPTIYLLDRIQSLDAPPNDKAGWFLDRHHLTSLGHEVWGAMMHEELENWVGNSAP